MSLIVLEAGALTTVQDRGRFGRAHLGVPRAGSLDAPAADLGNRLVGNHPDSALLETTLTGVVLRAVTPHWVAVTGARCPVRVAGVAVAHGEPHFLAAGDNLVVGAAETGVRSYVAVAGGVDVPPVLGSRSTDTLAWVGPPQVRTGDLVPVGVATGPPRAHDTPLPTPDGALRVLPGPRIDWFSPDAWNRLCTTSYVVGSGSNRVGLRLDGPALRRTRHQELASEGMVLGAVQVPPDGCPVVFLADHPVTGGYPVVAIVRAVDLAICAQLRPGQQVRFTPDRG